MSLSRRSFFRGLGATLIAAPAIVQITSLMPVKAAELWCHDIDCYEIADAYARRTQLTIDMLTREAISLFRNSNEFLRAIDETGWSDKPIGSQLRIRLPEDFRVRPSEQELRDMFSE